ncbi:MAG: hypothetical protein KKB50_07615 [Planctomycetes bacterium]|nr:hypothetical protein [Planctomycetota bacterium]
MNKAETLEARTVQLPSMDEGARAPTTLTELYVHFEVAGRPRYLQPRPAQWLSATASHLNQLLALPCNWDSYNAEQIAPEIVNSANSLLQTLGEKYDLPQPVVSPTRAGGVLLEWKSGPKELELEFVWAGAASYVYVDQEAGEEREGAVFPDSFDDGHILALLGLLT